MNKLQIALTIVLANTFVMAFKTQSFHWNVEGKRFYMYHKFFQDIYEELFDTVDILAENIRMIDAFAPISLAKLLEYSSIEEETDESSDGNSMVYLLVKANDEVLDSIEVCYEHAEAENNQGLIDLLGTRLAIHQKYRWMLKSTDKEVM